MSIPVAVQTLIIGIKVALWSYDYSGILELLHSLFLGKRQCTDISWVVKRAFLILKKKRNLQFQCIYRHKT